MQHLRGRIAKSDVRIRTYASSTVSRHFGAETKTENSMKTVQKKPKYFLKECVQGYSMPSHKLNSD